MAKRYLTQSNLKKNTLSDIFTFIIEKKETTRREIEAETGFSWGTVSSSVTALLEKGYIIEEKSAPAGTVGRTTYTLKPAARPFVSMGLDVNRSGYSLVLVGLDGTVCQTLAAPCTATTKEELVGEVEALIEKGLAAATAEGLQPFSLGVAMQGAVDGPKGLSLRFPHIKNWQVLDVKAWLGQKYGLPVYLAHDPKCMLLSELQQRTLHSCVLVRLNGGVGLSVLLDGKILYDTECMELGHTLVPKEGKLVKLDSLVTLAAIAAESGTTQEELLLDPARYREAIAAAGRHLGVAMYNLHRLFRPEAFIIAGKAANLMELMTSAASLLQGEVELIAAPNASAALGAATQSVRSAVKAFIL